MLKVINYNDYNSNMGIIIDIESSEIFMQKHIPGAINIPYEKLLYNRDKLLSKNETYYIYCNGGHKSKRAVSILDAYGYNVVQLIK